MSAYRLPSVEEVDERHGRQEVSWLAKHLRLAVQRVAALEQERDALVLFYGLSANGLRIIRERAAEMKVPHAET